MSIKFFIIIDILRNRDLLLHLGTIDFVLLKLFISKSTKPIKYKKFFIFEKQHC